MEDPRGKLFFEIPRLLTEFELDQRPPLIILENVPYLLYGAGRAWFDSIRRAIRRAGYWFREDSCWTVNVKDATSLPQDRERLFMVAASREHFTYNPFTPPVAVNNTNGHRRSLDGFIDRTRSESEYCLTGAAGKPRSLGVNHSCRSSMVSHRCSLNPVTFSTGLGTLGTCG